MHEITACQIFSLTFFEDGTKKKMPFKILPPLSSQVLIDSTHIKTREKFILSLSVLENRKLPLCFVN